MAGTGVWIRLLERHRARLSKDPDMKKVIPKLIKRGYFSNAEERYLAGITDASERTDLLLDKLSRDPDSFREFCLALEECAPHLLTELLLDRGEIFLDSNPDAEDQQALQLEFEQALRERDEAVRDQEQTWQELAEARQVLQAMQAERDRAVDIHRAQKRGEAHSSGSSLLDLEGSHLVEESGDSVVWQVHKVTLQRVANYGFGLAVSGGYDSPHFASGDPSIAISDVLKAGPAEGKLQLNDRIISVNGISLENVSHSMAIQVLKSSGDLIQLVIRRRVVMPTAVEKESPPLKVTLIKKNRKDEFGLVLGCRIYIQDIIADSLAAQDGALKVGDNILKINNTPLEGLSVTEVKKLIDKSKDRLQLIVSKTPLQPLDRQQHNNSRLKDDEGYSTYRPSHDKDDINVYRPSVHQEQSPYPGEPPPGLYPTIGQSALDGRYTYEQEPLTAPPPRQPHSPPRMGDRFDGPLGQPQVDEFYGSAPPMAPNDGYYSDHDGELYRGHPDDDMFGHPHSERYVGLRSDIRTDVRRVAFMKDRQKGLGLRLAGGNATGIFIASVQPGSDAEAEGLVEGDQILQANTMDIVGLTREEAVAYLTGLEGQVTLIVQYRKEDYDSIMASHEAGDSFYIRTHFTYQPNPETGEHSFKVGDIFHIKDTLFRGVGGSWLAIRAGPNGEELKKGTIPNRKKAESIASMQQGGAAVADAAQSKKGGSLFKRKATRRFKSLGKDHWEDVVFSDDNGAGLATKFPPYERVVLRDPAFVRPVVVFGAIADVARDMLLKEYPDRFESLHDDKAGDDDAKKVLGVPRISAIREAIGRRKHCVLDITPYHVDLLNYAQYYPIVIFLRGESKQAIKEVRSRWRGSGSAATKNPKKLQELNERMEALYSHLFTGILEHKTTDTWFLKLMEMISSQQQRPVWMSEKKPEEDFSDDLMFPMPSRLSLAASPDTDLDLGPPAHDLKLSPTQKTRLVRSSSDPSINTGDRVPGIPPYPAPPGYNRQPKMTRYGSVQNEWDDYRNPVLLKERPGEWQVPPDDQYYPQQQQPQPDGWAPTYPRPLSHPHQEQQPFAQHARSNIDLYATITPSERLRNRIPVGGDAYRDGGQRSPQPGPDSLPVDSRGYVEGPTSEPESFNRYMNRDVNKHDDSKLRDKFGALQTASNRDRAPGSHDPYRFTRSTANPVSSAKIDRAKLSHLQARYRQGEGQSKGGKAQSTLSQSAVDVRGFVKMKDPPPVPVKTYSLKEVSMEPESSSKDRNYENSNRSYNYSDHHYPPTHHEQDPNPLAMSPHHAPVDSPYEYISSRNVSMVRQARDRDVPPEVPPPPRENVDISRSYANSVYMDHREVERSRLGGMGAEPQGSRVEPGRYTRPRTDDEQLRALQQHGPQQSPSPADEQGRVPLWEREQGVPRHSKYKSWDSEKEGQRTFDAYKKLITPGFYGARNKFSKSHTELREESSNAHSSAFETYRKSPEFSEVASGKRQYNWSNKLSVPQSEKFTVTSQYDYSLEAPHTHIPPPPPPTIFTELPPPSFPLPQPPMLPIASILTAFPADKVRVDQKVNGKVMGHGPSHSTGMATDPGQGWSAKRVVESGHTSSTGKFAESGQGQSKVTDVGAVCSDHRQGQSLSNGEGYPGNSRAKSHWYSQIQWDESSETEIVPRRQANGCHAGTYPKRAVSLKDKILSSKTKFHLSETSNFTGFKISDASMNQPIEAIYRKANPGITDCDENGKSGDFIVTEQHQDTCKFTDVQQNVQSNTQIGKFDIVKKSKRDIGLTGTYNALESEEGVYNIPSEENKLFLSNNDQPLRGRSPVRRLLEKRMSNRAKRSRSLDTARAELHLSASTNTRATSVAERVRDIQSKLSLAPPPPYVPFSVSRSVESQAQHPRLSQATSVPISSKPAASVARSKSLDISVPARPPPPYPYGKYKQPGNESQSAHISREKKLGPIEAYLPGQQEFVSGKADVPAVQKLASDKECLYREQKSDFDEAYLSGEQERFTKLANPQSLSQRKLSHLAPPPPPPPLVTTHLPFVIGEIKRSDEGIQNRKDELDKTVDEGEEYQIDDIDEELGKLTNRNNSENKLTGPNIQDNIKNNEVNSKNTESKYIGSISGEKSNGIISKNTSRLKPEFMVNGKAKDLKQAQANAKLENGWRIDQRSKQKANKAESLKDKNKGKEDRSSGKTSLRRLFGMKGAKDTDSKNSRKVTDSKEEGMVANSPHQLTSLRQRNSKPIFYSQAASASQSSAETDQTERSKPLPVNSLCTVKHNGCSIVEDTQPVELFDTSLSKTGDGAACPGETYTSREMGEREKTAESKKDKRTNPDTSEYLQNNGIEMEDGHAVVATARGTFTSAGGILESKETGVCIVVPEGALEDGESQEIYFKVCNTNSILPPLDEDKGETLLSPLVMCGPHGLKFKKPVELLLPHTASVNPESWSFALKSSDSPSGQPTDWHNMNLAGSEGVTQGRVSQTSVSVLVDHF